MASATTQNGGIRSPVGGKVMAFIGCGTLGTGILTGIVAATSNEKTAPSVFDEESNLLFPPTRYIATCRSDSAAKRIKGAFESANTRNLPLRVIQNDNVTACAESDIILIGCKPYMVAGILSAPGMVEALKGKILISICAGVTSEDIEDAIYNGGMPESGEKFTVIRAMPNTAAGIRESMTVLATPSKPISETVSRLMETIFKCIGEVVWLPSSQMDAATALCGSGPAFFLLLLEAAIDGGVAMGLPRAEATKMAAQTMKGACMGVLGDEAQGRAPVHPAVLKDRVTTPGGCTIGGLMVLEEGAARGTVAKAIRAATIVASKLGQGVKNVNGRDV